MTGRNASIGANPDRSKLLVDIGAELKKGATEVEHTRALAASMFHEFVHAELLMGDPSSELVGKFKAYREGLSVALGGLEVEKLSDDVVNAIRSSGVVLREGDVQEFRETLKEFIVNEAFVFREEERHFGHARGAESLEEHLTKDIAAKAHDLFQRGLRRGVTWDAPEKFLREKIGSFARDATAAIERGEEAMLMPPPDVRAEPARTTFIRARQ